MRNAIGYTLALAFFVSLAGAVVGGILSLEPGNQARIDRLREQQKQEAKRQALQDELLRLQVQAARGECM